MKVTNKFNLPEPVVAALTHDDYSRGESNRSVTQLIGSPRVRILKKEHEAKITFDASELVWIALGKGIHKMFEDHAGGKWRPEERLFADVSGWTISGQVDIQHHADGTVTMYDYKITSVWSVIFWKDDYDKQLNFYAWLARQNGMRVSALNIVFVLRDWRKSDSEQGRIKDYPKAPIMVLPAKLWSDEEQDAYVAERVAVHQSAEFDRLAGETLPYCTDEERWAKEDKFAVMKKGRKTAVRVLDTADKAQAMADDLGPGHYVEERPGEKTRCAQGWCPVAEWCDQWQDELEKSNAA